MYDKNGILRCKVCDNPIPIDPTVDISAQGCVCSQECADNLIIEDEEVDS